MSRHCYVVGCANGDYRLKRWRGEKCTKHGTPVFQGDAPCDCLPPFTLHAFPGKKKNTEARIRWMKAINRADPQRPVHWLEPTKNQVVCSAHFVEGRPTELHPDPGLLLRPEGSTPTKRGAEGSAACDRKRRLIQREVRKQCTCRIESVEEEAEPFLDDQGADDQPLPLSSEPKKKCVLTALKFIIFVLLMVIRKMRQDNSSLRRKNIVLRNYLQLQKRNRQNASRQQGHESLYKKLIETDKDVKFFTGISTRTQFSKLHSFLSQFVRRRWRGLMCVVANVRRFHHSPRKFGPRRKLTSTDEFLLVLMKLRLGLLNYDIAKRFAISTTLCSQIFHSWLAAMAKILGKTIIWPSKEQVLASKPSRYSSLPDIRAIIDCSEIFVETPKDPNLQNATWSNYKHHNTAKFLIAVAPNSAITFISSVYGGRVSDKEITLDSGFLDKCDPFDMIQADKGFSIGNECASRLLSLHLPPGLRGQVQMASVAVEKTKKVANLRILVEQVIRRLKTFRILSAQLPLTLVPSLDRILTVCAALSNLKDPIYKD